MTNDNHLNTASEAVKILKDQKLKNNPLFRIWHGLPEPKIITVLYAAVYLNFLVYGLAQIFYSVGFSADNLTPVLTNLVASTFVIGGTIALASIPKGYWQFERGGIILVATGLITQFIWTLLDPVPGIHLGVEFRIHSSLLFLTIRYCTIMWARMDPEK